MPFLVENKFCKIFVVCGIQIWQNVILTYVFAVIICITESVHLTKRRYIVSVYISSFSVRICSLQYESFYFFLGLQHVVLDDFCSSKSKQI